MGIRNTNGGYGLPRALCTLAMTNAGTRIAAAPLGPRNDAPHLLRLRRDTFHRLGKAYLKTTSQKNT